MQLVSVHDARKPRDHLTNRARITSASALLIHALLLCCALALRYALVVSKLLPPTGNVFLDFLRLDNYYSTLIPLLVPMYFIFAMLNWLGYKIYSEKTFALTTWDTPAPL